METFTLTCWHRDEHNNLAEFELEIKADSYDAAYALAAMMFPQLHQTGQIRIFL